MNSAKQEIQYKQEELKSLEITFNQVMEKLKKDSKEYNADSIGNISRRLMCFFFGEYSNWYDESYKFSKKFKISNDQNWSKLENKFIINEKCYRIYKYENSTSGNLIGFICKKSDLIDEMHSDYLFDFWCWYCKQNNYKESLAFFVEEFKTKIDLFIEKYHDYLNRDDHYNHILEVINEPSIKVKDMVLCITRVKEKEQYLND